MSSSQKILTVIKHDDDNIKIAENLQDFEGNINENYVFNSSDDDVNMKDISDEDSDEENIENNNLLNQIISPGDLVIKSSEYMKGHNTYTTQDTLHSTSNGSSDEKKNNDEINIYSSTLGVLSKINKLISVTNINKNLYQAEIGDHIIGQIVEVTSTKKWKLNINGNNLANLQLSSINLPGGLLRRKNEQDELNMKQLLKVGDLINCEVQGVHSNGNDINLHTRSLKYGKLRNGALIKVKMGLIQRKKTHTHFFNNNSIKIILGCNGFIWVSHEKAAAETVNKNKDAESIKTDITRIEQDTSFEIYSDINDPSIDLSKRILISKYVIIIKILAFNNLVINEQRINAVYELILSYTSSNTLSNKSSNSKEILFVLNDFDIMKDIAYQLVQGEKMRG
ncbi:hypothetical protein QEN19_001209 [Hanseniaspora menglaensis]